MTSPADETSLDPCGCCEPEPAEAAIENAPGLPALAYRIGDQAMFFRRMAAGLSRQGELAVLTTRSTDDPAIALVDAWATAADVITFYQERIANEGFLRTATERRSVLELAQAIGYELNPGVAAETFLAFTLDEAPGAPREVTVPAGTQVQSIPAKQGELPQTFETAQAFVARPEWNRLVPRRSRPQTITLRRQGPIFSVAAVIGHGSITVSPDELYVQGTDAGLESGDKLLFVGAGGLQSVRSVVEVEVQGRRTRVRHVSGGRIGIRPGQVAELPDVVTPGPFTPAFAPGPGAAPSPAAPVGSLEAISGSVPFNEDRIQDALSAAPTEKQLQAVLLEQGWRAEDVRLSVTTFLGRVQTSDVQVFAFREKTGFFGHNAPDFFSLPEELQNRFGGVGSTRNWDLFGWEIWRNHALNVENNYFVGVDVFLERVVSGIAPGSWVILERPGPTVEVFQVEKTVEESLTGFTQSGRATGLKLTRDADDFSPEEKDGLFKVRNTTAHARSERLPLAELPIDTPLAAGVDEIVLDGFVLGLQEGGLVALSGEQHDAAGVLHSEILELRQVLHEADGHTHLQFTNGLRYSYRRDSVNMNANVVRATHGESVAGEVLGSGDASQPHQRFALKKPPLTYVSAPTASGAESSLSVRVNGLEWRETGSLYPLGPDDPSYIVRHDDAGGAEVVFGDGQRGARLPTGQENITATYRSGIGSAGEVAASSLSLLKTRPLGVRSVTNPVPAAGSADPEKLEDARQNAPLTVLTLDRVVSLQDYEGFARAFAGVGKARAATLWDGQHQVVHVTIAGPDGEAIEAGSSVRRNLLRAMEAARDPLQEVRLGGYRPLLFNLTAGLLVEPAYRFEDVRVEVEAELVDRFGFAARGFGQPVTAAEVIAAIQGVPGVRAVDLDGLSLSTGSGTLEPVLPARLARLAPDGRQILPAELLMLNQFGITLTEITS